VRKKTSIRKAQANRRNARQSTGPKTQSGKKRVRWNSLKHGLLAKEVVISAGDGEESTDEFLELLAHLRDDVHPVGVLEEMLVERIATCYWRLRRVVRCEVGEIRRRLDTAGWTEVFRRAEQFNFDKKWAITDESRQNLKRTSLGLIYLINVLENVKDIVEEEGYVTDHAQQKLIQNFGGDEGGISCLCFAFSKMITEGPPSPEEEPEIHGTTPRPEKCQEVILTIIEEEKSKLEQLKESVVEIEGLEMDGLITSLTLPAKDPTDKILRYETTIERQLYRAISQLERLQRQRQGDTVPPPISVDVTTGK